MSKCSNCNKSLNCGCQKRIASDGKNCCTSCLVQYEANLNSQRLTQQAVIPPVSENTAPIITSITSPDGIIYNNLNV